MNTTAKMQQTFTPVLRPLARLRKGYLRPVEFAAIALFLASAFAVGYIFFNVVGERSQAISSLRSESKQLDSQIAQLKSNRITVGNEVKGTETALANLEEFNNRFLKDRIKGRLLLIDEINGLIKKNNMRLQGTISFKPIEDADTVALREQEKNQKVRRSKADAVDVYPGIRTTFTVSGQYEEFRRFLYDMETNDLFVIIESLNLQTNEGPENNIRNVENSPRGNNLAGPNSANDLNIQLNLKVYFRKQAPTDAAN